MPFELMSSNEGAVGEAVHGARRAVLPPKAELQLATLASSAPAGDDWLHEIKLDGYRLVCRVAGDDVRLITRSGKDWTDRFPRLAEAAAALPCDEAVLDGEAAVLNARGISEFQALQNALSRRHANVLYFAFDLLYLDGYDLTRAPLRARKEALAGLLAAAPADGPIRYSDHVEGHGAAFFQRACAMGLEGIISKRADRPYRAGRGTEWLKVKCMRRQEFVVVGFTDPSGTRTAFGALLLAVNNDEGRLVFAGRVGTGFSERTLRDLHAQLKHLERDTPPIEDPPRGAEARGVHWVTPRLVAEVSFAEWTSDGRIRHPSFLGLREDKKPEEVVHERVNRSAGNPSPRRGEQGKAGAPERRGAQKSRSRSGQTRPPAKTRPTEDVVAGVRITHADRSFYKGEDIGKGDIARYWDAVADAALPYLRDRPLMVLRCTEGAAGPCFFQKHWGRGMPESVPRVDVEEQDGTRQYMYVNGETALITLVQFGVLEVHVWGARRDRLDKPDQLTFDLDPDEGLPWDRVVDAAVALRERLGHLGLETFVRTTGGKGLHVMAPLVRRAGWDEVREFTRAVAQELVESDPQGYTATASKKGRKGKIFIDYLRNAANGTVIASFSPRAREGAPVAVPLAWDELDAGAERPVFTVNDVPDRVRKQKRDPWDGFTSLRQSLPRKRGR